MPIARVYRFGFDVKLVTLGFDGALIAGGIHLDAPSGVTSYDINFAHGLGPAASESRFEFPDGAVYFQYEANIGQPTLDWASYRVELSVDTSRYALCRDGKKVREGVLDYMLTPPTSAAIQIGIEYVNWAEAPFEIRFDNAFLEVIP